MKENKTYSFFTLLRKNISAGFIIEARKISQREGYQISYEEIEDLYNLKKTQNIEEYIKSKKAKKITSTNMAVKMFNNKKESTDSFFKLIEFLSKNRKVLSHLSIDELIKLQSEGYNAENIAKVLLRAKKGGLNINADQIKKLFYSQQTNEELLAQFVTIKKQFPSIRSKDIKTAFMKNINLHKMVNVTNLLNSEDIKLPYNVFIDLLKDDINIVKAIRILSQAKKNSVKELKKHKLFNDRLNNRLANVYTIEGKERFKKVLSMSILEKNFLIDPVKLYYKLVKSEEQGFKITLHTIREFLSFSFTPDIDMITESYLIARQKGLYITFQQLAKLAEKNIDVRSFIDAQIKSRSDD